MKNAGRINVTYNFGKEIYKNNEICNCYIEMDNSQSDIAVVGLKAKLVEIWNVTIGEKTEGKRLELNSAYQDIFIAKGQKGSCSIGIEVKGKDDN